MNQIIKLKTEHEWQSGWEALRALRQDLELENFLSSREDLLSRGYEFFGLNVEDKIVCVAGLVIYPHVVRGSDCWVYDLATLETERSKGFGATLLSFIENYAKEQGCTRISLHSRLHREDAHRFYEKQEGWEKTAYVFGKEL